MAGPVSNLLLAYAALTLRAALIGAYYTGGPEGLGTAIDFLAMTAVLSVGLGLFNLIPFPPLDGSKVVEGFLPDRIYYGILRYERWGDASSYGDPVDRRSQHAVGHCQRLGTGSAGEGVLLAIDADAWIGEGERTVDSPIYHLEKVVKARAEALEDFTGPLDLILHLLSKNKMEIKDIQISVILEQYLAWMERRKKLDLEVASEFVTMAAQLIFIKSRMLLSIHDEEALSEMEQLIASLEAHQRHENYMKIKSVIPEFTGRYALGRDYITKGPEQLPVNRPIAMSMTRMTCAGP